MAGDHKYVNTFHILYSLCNSTHCLQCNSSNVELTEIRLFVVPHTHTHTQSKENGKCEFELPKNVFLCYTFNSDHFGSVAIATKFLLDRNLFTTEEKTQLYIYGINSRILNRFHSMNYYYYFAVECLYRVCRMCVTNLGIDIIRMRANETAIIKCLLLVAVVGRCSTHSYFLFLPSLAGCYYRFYL